MEDEHNLEYEYLDRIKDIVLSENRNQEEKVRDIAQALLDYSDSMSYIH